MLNVKNLVKYALKKSCAIFKPLELKLVKKYAVQALQNQPVFIVGAPRTGSTILYQLLTSHFEVLYFDNLFCRLNEIPFLAFCLSKRFFGCNVHKSFESRYGNTRASGLHAPSECGAYWYRWLPKDRHFIDYEDFNEKIADEIRDELSAIINRFSAPLVIKNLNAGQRLRLLKQCFPMAKFIYIKRDPVFVAQSILEAKRNLNLRDNDFWSIKPPNYRELLHLNAYEQIVKQIFYLQKQIEEDLKLFPPENILLVNYGDLATKLDSILVESQNFIGARKRVDVVTPEIFLSEKLRLDKSELEKIEIEISKLDWDANEQ